MTKKFIVNYDLVSPGRDYSRVIEWLSSNGGVRTQLSTWLIKTSPSINAAKLRDWIGGLIDSSDRLFISEIGTTGDWAYQGTLSPESVKQILCS
jgi:hypothetical protein